MRRLLRRFTLVEFLVILSILAILAGLFLPALGRAPRSSVHRAVCASNQKQLSLAVILLAEEHDKRLPFELSFDEMGDADADVYLHGGETVAPYERNQALVQFDPAKAELRYFGLMGPVARAAQANVVFMNRLYRGGRGVLPDARVYFCRGDPRGTPALPKNNESFGMDNAPGYGANQRVRGTSRPDAPMLSDLTRIRGDQRPRSLTDPPTDAEVRGIQHPGKGRNVAFRDGSVRWFEAGSTRGLAGSSDADDVFMSTGDGVEGGQPLEDAALY